MFELPGLLASSAFLGGSATLLYVTTLIFLGLVSVFAPTPQRRREARTTLGILVRRKNQ